MSRDDLEHEVGLGRPPGNLAAEHAILGALLYDNSALIEVEGLIQPSAFLEPYHGRVYSHARELIHRGQLADAITVGQKLETEPAFEPMGGYRFLVDLVDRAPPPSTAPDYARIVGELWQRRTLAAIGDYLGRAARGREGDIQAATMIDEAERGLLEVQRQDKRIELVSASEAVDQVLEQYQNPAAAAGVSLGLDSLDNEIGGIMSGELWLIGGRPGMGKSALAGCAALNIARDGRHPDGSRLGVIEINAEMTPAQMMRRHITDHAFDLSGLDAPQYRDIRRRSLEAHEEEAFFRAAQDLRGLETLKSVKRTGMTISTLKALIRRQVAIWRRMGIRLGLVTVDHVGLIRPDREGRSRMEDQTEVAIRLKELADELDVPIVALAQLNRGLEARDDKRPTLPDLRDTGAWEENADGVIGVYRDAYYASREQEPKKRDQVLEWEARKESKIVEAILLKVREGSSGVVKLWCDIGRNVIRSKEPDSIFGYTSPARRAAMAASTAAPPLPGLIEEPAKPPGQHHPKPAPAPSSAPEEMEFAPREGPDYDPDEFA